VENLHIFQTPEVVGAGTGPQTARQLGRPAARDQTTDVRGTKYTRFEDLPAWKAAMDLAGRVYRLTRYRLYSQLGALRHQLRRASPWVSNSIAEGFERGSTAELKNFLYIACCLPGEVSLCCDSPWN
jgi:hypothetical protein